MIRGMDDGVNLRVFDYEEKDLDDIFKTFFDSC